MYGEQARFFNDEIHPTIKHTKKGLVAMAGAFSISYMLDCNTQIGSLTTWHLSTAEESHQMVQRPPHRSRVMCDQLSLDVANTK
jgi:hypothetical protein